MDRKPIVFIVAALAIGASAISTAADRDSRIAQGGGASPRGEHSSMMEGCPMMGGGMMRGMMGRGSANNLAMPQLPPGNEKLQVQMWSEMTQKMGEIAGKYAAQAK
jgi:hypothetical protein